MFTTAHKFFMNGDVNEIIKNIQRGNISSDSPSSGTFGSDNIRYVDISITAVNTSKSIIIHDVYGGQASSTTNAQTGAGKAQHTCHAYFVDGTTIRFYMINTADSYKTIHGSWQVIEFNNSVSVQTGTIDVEVPDNGAVGDSDLNGRIYDLSVETYDSSRSLFFHTIQTAGGSSSSAARTTVLTNPHENGFKASPRIELNSSSTVRISTTDFYNNTYVYAYGRYYLVTLPSNAITSNTAYSQTATAPTSTNDVTAYKDITLSPTVTLTKSAIIPENNFFTGMNFVTTELDEGAYLCYSGRSGYYYNDGGNEEITFNHVSYQLTASNTATFYSGDEDFTFSVENYMCGRFRVIDFNASQIRQIWRGSISTTTVTNGTYPTYLTITANLNPAIVNTNKVFVLFTLNFGTDSSLSNNAIRGCYGGDPSNYESLPGHAQITDSTTITFYGGRSSTISNKACYGTYQIIEFY